MIEELRDKLREFIPAEEGAAIRSMLESYAAKNYVPKHAPSVYLNYMNGHTCSFDRNGSQCVNHPYVWTMFSVPSQHVMGDCIEECFDKALFKAGWS